MAKPNPLYLENLNNFVPIYYYNKLNLFSLNDIYIY